MRPFPKGWYNWPAIRKNPPPWYNSLCVAAGLWLLTDEWNTFFGYLLIAEGFLWTIEYAGHRNKVPYVPTINDVSGP